MQDQQLLRRGLRMVAGHLRASPVPSALSIGGAVLFAASLVASTVVLGRIVDDVLEPAFSGDENRGAMVVLIIALFAVAVAKSVGVIARRFFAGMLAARSKAGLQIRVSDRLLSVPLTRLRAVPPGKLMAHIDSDAQAAVQPLHALPFSVGVVALLFFAVLSLLVVDPMLTLVGLVLLPTLMLMQRIHSKHIEEPSLRVRQSVADVSTVAHESFEGVTVVKTLGREEAEAERFGIEAERLRVARIDMAKIGAAFEAALGALPDIGVIVLVLVGAGRINSGAITFGELVQAVALFGVLSLPVRIIGYFLGSLPQATVARERIDVFLAEPDDPLLSPKGATPLTAGPLGVEVDDVTIVRSHTTVLDRYNLRVEPGESVALVGPTGSGKSTLFHTLARLIVPDDGRIELGQVPLLDIEGRSLRSGVALVFQEAFLFADSLARNISLDGDDEVFESAARIAQIDRFVGDLPEGYDTVVGERGVTLSGGQRQRVALARALVRRPGLLMLDDATSAVDPSVEQAILAGLREVNTTVLIVAHRLSTIRLADRVVYMSGGRVQATGTHRDLLAIPAYESLVRAYEQEVDVA